MLADPEQELNFKASELQLLETHCDQLERREDSMLEQLRMCKKLEEEDTNSIASLNDTVSLLLEETMVAKSVKEYLLRINEEQKSKSEAEMEVLRNKLEEVEDELDEWKNKHHNSRQQLNEYRKEVAELKSRNTDLEEEADSLTQELSSQKKSKTDEKAIKKLQETVEKQKKILEEAKKQREKMEQKFEESSNEDAVKVKKLKGALRAMRDQMFEEGKGKKSTNVKEDDKEGKEKPVPEAKRRKLFGGEDDAIPFGSPAIVSKQTRGNRRSKKS